MLTLTGVIQNVFPAPEGVNKKGESYGGGWKVQLLCDEQLENGHSRMGLVTLSTTHDDWFKSQIGSEAVLPVGAISGRNQVTYFITKAWKPPQKASQAVSAILK